MKKYFVLLLFTAIATLTRGNVAFPSAKISEIFVDNMGNWTIELGFYSFYVSDIDSIRVETSTGSAKVNSYSLLPGGGYLNFDSLSVITNVNLSSPITLNPAGDFVKITSYSWGEASFDYVAIGNWPGSVVDCLHAGESVSYLTYIQSSGNSGSFCIDKSPTIGMENDTAGALSTFSGLVYDLSGIVFTDGWFPLSQIHNAIIHIHPDGSFSERIHARRISFDTIQIYFPPWPYRKEIYTIEPVNNCTRHDSLWQQNIITTSLVLNSIEQPVIFQKVTVSPNPFTSTAAFYFNSTILNLSKELNLLIFTLDGKKIHEVNLPGNQSSYRWSPNGTIPPGILLYQLISNGHCLDSGKLIKL